MPGARRTRSLVCKMKKHTSKSPQVRRTGRHSLRDGFTVSFVLSPVIGLFCHRHPRSVSFQELDASVETSGPHDFAVRFSRVRRSQDKEASTASRTPRS
jgi:hypothetical protein